MVLPLGISIDSLRRSSGTFDEAVGLPPAVYSDPDFHRFEMDAVFGGEWLCVGRQEQIPHVGDYLSVTRAGEPLIVARSTDESVRVNRCPYHYWIYDLDGQLIGAPEMSKTAGFDMAGVQLPSGDVPQQSVASRNP